MLDHQLARPRTFVLAQENDRRAPARHHRRTIMTGVHSRTLTQACYGLPLGSRWSGSIKPCILPAPVAAGLAICAMRDAPLIGQQTLVDYARGCQSTTHRPLNCRCDCKRARTEHGSDAADMPGQYEVSRAPHSHTVHIRFSGPSNVREICPHWTKGRLSLPEPDETRLCSRGLGRASTSPPRAAVAVAVIGRAVVATHVRRTAATGRLQSSRKAHRCVPHRFRG